jgi:Fe-S-cluster-containing dehydrogenase component
MGLKRIFIDLEVCRKCKERICKCSYPYHPENDGVASLLEQVMRIEVCRKCEEAPCVAACPKEALEKQPDGTVKRYSMRCIGCNTCVLACPFGAVSREIIPYLTSHCDYCTGRLKEGEEHLCVRTCPEGAVKYIEVEESEDKNIYFIGDKLAVHSIPWTRDKAAKKS